MDTLKLFPLLGRGLPSKPGLSYRIESFQLLKPHLNQHFIPSPDISLQRIANKSQLLNKKLILYLIKFIKRSNMIEIETKYLQVMKLLYTIQCDQCIMIKIEL